MPYIKEYNTFYINIPYTNGELIEKYLQKLINHELTESDLYTESPNNIQKAYQYMSYNKLQSNKILYKRAYNTDLENPSMLFFTIVKNPYERVIDFLIHNNIEINENTIKKHIHNIIPQYEYIDNETNNVIVLKWENLLHDMKHIGFENIFETLYNSETNDVISGIQMLKYDYNDILNEESLNIIYNYFKRDFIQFEYKRGKKQQYQYDISLTPSITLQQLPIYISMTTIPARLQYIHKTIDSILEQTVQPIKIFLNIPKRYYRFPDEKISKELCDELEGKYEILKINYIEEDYGPGTKLLGTLITNNEKPILDNNGIIILIDDDVVYQNNMIELIVNAYKEHNKMNISFSFYTYEYNNITVGQAVDAFSIPVYCLNNIIDYYKTIINYDMLPSSIFLYDDFWISYYLHKKNIEIKFLETTNGKNIYEVSNDIHALFLLDGKFNRENVAEKSYKKILLMENLGMLSLYNNNIKLHIVTVASDKTKLKQLKQSAHMNNVNIDYILLNTWNGFEDKITNMIDYVKKIKPTDIVCFIDAYDVLIFSGIEEILKKFYEYNCDILFSSEKACFPNINYENYEIYYKEKKPLTEFKFLNSGGYIGYAKNILEMLTWKSTDEIKEICKTGGDQNYYTKYFFNNKTNTKIKLDYYQKIFQAMCTVDYFNDLLFLNGRLYNKILHEFPCFTHFMGFWEMDPKMVINLKTNEEENALQIFLEKMIRKQRIETIEYKYPYDD